jgi:TonB family protein
MFGPPLCVKRKPARQQGAKDPQQPIVGEGWPGGRASVWSLVQCSQMKPIIFLLGILLLSTVAYSQSGRRSNQIKVVVPPPPVQEAAASSVKKETEAAGTASVTAERNQDYRCSDDGTLERILDPAEEGTNQTGERILSAKETDSRVVITSKPQPAYTKEARRNGIQGFVALKVLLSGNGKVSRIRVLKRLPAGLTETAIFAACRMKFKPALKDGVPVSQWVTAEYAFRLADSSIFRP